jgi:DNA-binding MarR family transcriptional regulator
MKPKLDSAKLARLAVDVEAFDKLEAVIHTKGRLAIVSVLAAAESLTFTELRGLLKLTDGNLAAHLRALDEAGYVVVNKRGDGRPVTEIALSASGRNAFRHYLEGLEHIVKRHC